MTDLAIRLLVDGYRAIERDRDARRGSATYPSRLTGRRAVVLAGAEGAATFYDESLVEREGAVPPPLAWLLFGRGAVHGLDGEVHHRRKSMFLAQVGPHQVGACAALARELLDASAPTWDSRTELHDELVVAYGTAVLRWVGVDLPPDRLASLSREYAHIVDGFGFASPRTYARAWVARRRTDRWSRMLIGGVRDGRWTAPHDSALAAIAASDLDERTAGVELGNIVRPTVAVSWLGVHAAAALAELDEDQRTRLSAGDQSALRWSCAQEVRRTAPFVPALAGRVRRSSRHAGLELHAGDRVVLDVRGIDLDPRRYPEPLEFRPDRFLHDVPGPFELVPQGGGSPEGHRCPGESMTLQLLVHTIEVLAGLPPALVDGPPDLSRIPTRPVVAVAVSAPSVGTGRHDH